MTKGGGEKERKRVVIVKPEGGMCVEACNSIL